MKKEWVILSVICLSVSLLPGCQRGFGANKTEIEQITADFFLSDYDYEETTTYYDAKDRPSSKLVIEGQLFQDPYKEHLKITPYRRTRELPSSESYRAGKWNFITVYVPAEDGWVKQMQQRLYPHGYGRDITFGPAQADPTNADLEIYTAEYIEDLGENYDIKEDVSAVITQKYYIDKKQRIVVRVETDLTDSNKKYAMIVDMAENGTSIEQAKEKVSTLDDMKETVTRNIFNFGNATDFELP